MEGFLRGGGPDISGAASPDGTRPGISGEAVSVASPAGFGEALLFSPF